MVADRAQWENEKERGKTDRHLGSMDEVQRVGKGVRVRDRSRVEGSGDGEKGGWKGGCPPGDGQLLESEDRSSREFPDLARRSPPPGGGGCGVEGILSAFLPLRAFGSNIPWFHEGPASRLRFRDLCSSGPFFIRRFSNSGSLACCSLWGGRVGHD